MLLQVTLDLESLSSTIHQLLPFEIRLSDADGPDHTLFVDRPEHLEIVADRGLRMDAPARLRWTIAGVAVPVTVTSARILLIPEIAEREGHDYLSFSFFVEQADLKHVPAFIDDKVVDKVNEALRSEGARLEWKFLDTLTFGCDLPASIKPKRRLELNPRWGALKITEEAFICSVSYHSAIVDEKDDGHAT